MNTETELILHPTAIIEPGAQLAPGVSIGAYAYIGPQVKLGVGTIIHHHATVDGLTTLGSHNEVFPYAFIGGKTHDKKYKGGSPGLRIGDRNIFREYTTVHTATHEGHMTVLGDDNLLLAYAHVGHDCQIASGLTMSCHAALAGHVVVEDFANIGGLVGVHQFCRLGAYSMIGFSSKVTQDVPPFMLIDGNPAEVRTFNKIGLERAHFSLEQLDTVKYIYQTLYRSGLNKGQAQEVLRQGQRAKDPLVEQILAFVEKSERGWV